MLNRKIAPPIMDAVDFNLKLKSCESFELDNKTEVYAIDAGAEEVLSLELVFKAGNGFEPKNLVASVTNYLLKNGTKTKSAFEINEAFDFYGSYLSVSCYHETASITLSCLSKHLSDLLPKLAELIIESNFPAEELVIYKKNQKQRLEMNLQKGDFVAGRWIDVFLFGENHPYGKFTKAEDIDALATGELSKFYESFYSTGQCSIFIAGRLPKDWRRQLNSHFGALPFRNSEVLAKIDYTKTPSDQKLHTIINDEKSVQGAIRIARPFPNRTSEDWPKMQVLNTIFGGYFGSRLMSNIREDKGYTYGIHSYIQNHHHESAFMISTEAGRDVCNETIKEVWKEASILKEELVKEDELKLVRNYLIGSILGSLDGPFQIINRWKGYILNGLNEDFFYNSLEVIKTIQAEELRELAQKYFIEEDFYQLTVI